MPCVDAFQGRCRIFTAGLDIDFKQSGGALLGSSSDTGDDVDPGRRAVALDRSIKLAQDSVSAVERCRKPVIVVVDGACIGGGVDLICACDIRYVCSTFVFDNIYPQLRTLFKGMNLGSLVFLLTIINSQLFTLFKVYKLVSLSLDDVNIEENKTENSCRQLGH